MRQKIVWLLILVISATSANAGPSVCYFRNSDWPTLNDCSSYSAKSFSRHLKAANEPVLGEGGLKDTVRLTIISAFKGTVVVNLYQTAGGSWVGQIKQFYLRPGSSAAKNLKARKFMASAESLAELRNELGSGDFWDKLKEPRGEQVIGSDGSYWLLESQLNGKYYAAQEWWPENGPLFDAGSRILQMARIPLFDR